MGVVARESAARDLVALFARLAILQCIQLVFGAVFFTAIRFDKMPIGLVSAAGCAAIGQYRLRAHVVQIQYLRFRFTGICVAGRFGLLAQLSRLWL